MKSEVLGATIKNFKSKKTPQTKKSAVNKRMFK